MKTPRFKALGLATALMSCPALSVTDTDLPWLNRVLPTSTQALTASPQNDWWLAVSFSMPESSLINAARVAAARQLALVFRGLPIEDLANPAVTDSQATLAERFGLHWIARTQARFEPLQKEGAAIEIDPERFVAAHVQDVPQLVFVCSSNPNIVFRLKGDVSPDWAVRKISDQLTRAQRQADARAAAKDNSANAINQGRLACLNEALAALARHQAEPEQ